MKKEVKTNSNLDDRMKENTICCILYKIIDYKFILIHLIQSNTVHKFDKQKYLKKMHFSILVFSFYEIFKMYFYVLHFHSFYVKNMIDSYSLPYIND